MKKSKRRQMPAEKERVLLHGLPGVGVSTLASQWYCEMKTDLALRHPEITIESRAIDLGVEGHDELSRDAEPITAEEFEKELLQKQHILLHESRFDGTFEGVHIVGIPDLVDFTGRRCELVLEFKFSRRPDPFVDRRVQSLLYGWLLDQNGYDVRRLICAICVIPPIFPAATKRGKVELLEASGLLEEVLEACQSSKRGGKRTELSHESPMTLSHEDWTMHFYKYDRPTAERQLRWCLDYWLGRRKPLPTTHAAKCRKCPYNAAGACPSALAPADDSFRVRKRKGGMAVKVPWSG